MKIGVLGDIHGNSLALEAVLKCAEREHVERLLITGDLVGYYFAVQDVLRLLKGWETVIARGNHEDMLAAVRSTPSLLEGIGEKYGGALAATLTELSEADLDKLCSLNHPVSLVVGNLKVLLCHGSPWDNNHYVYPDADAKTLDRCAITGFDFVIMGQTHYPLLRKIGNVTLLNPGSVGQPRNRKPGAQWALLDSFTGEVSLRNENYDYYRVAAEARLRAPELPFLSEVLTRT